jgi:subtilisin family serine protease
VKLKIGGKIMAEIIKLKRGGREVIFKKDPSILAVRLKHGRATNEMVLEASLGRPKAELKHVDSAISEKMEIFSIKETDKLEDTMDELRKASESDVITHVYTMDDTEKGRVIPTGTLTIIFKSGVKKNERENLLAEFGLEIVNEIDYLPNGYTVKLTEDSKKNPLKISAELQQREQIEIAEFDMAFKVSFQYVPADELYPRQWHLKNRGDSLGLKEGADVKAEEAWEISRGSRNITLSIMDDAVDIEHPEFNAPRKIVAPRDFGQDDTDPSPFGHDDNHGTACAGVAVAEENGTGIVGLAPGCALMPIRMHNELSDDNVVALFQYAIDNNADVISCSWSAASDYFPLSAKISGIIRKAATQGRRNKKGCVILFAASNRGSPLDGEKDGRIFLNGFAVHPNVIAVGASNSLDEHSSYSNFGPELALCAPSNGRGSFSGKRGRGICTTDRLGLKGYDLGDYTYSFGGTSSATPLAAGLAALLLSVNPELTSSEVKQCMMKTADKIDEENGQYVDGHSPFYGHGRINAHKALLCEVISSKHSVENIVNKKIPDMGELDDLIMFPYEVTIKDIEISIDIRHTYRGDLRVILTSPQGEDYILVDRIAPGWRNDIIQIFRSTDEPELFKSIIGSSAKGEWHLKVMDMSRFIIGELRKWGLTISHM